MKSAGFTLIELMLVVAIIGLLAAIAIPRFANLVIKAKEAAVKGKVGSLRSAVSIYYANNEGIYPGMLDALTGEPHYLDALPKIGIPTFPAHVETDTPLHFPIGPFMTLDWAGAVGYPGTAFVYFIPTGELRVNCTHTDTKGVTWSLY